MALLSFQHPRLHFSQRCHVVAAVAAVVVVIFGGIESPLPVAEEVQPEVESRAEVANLPPSGRLFIDVDFGVGD